MTRPVIVALHGVGASAAGIAQALAPLDDIADIVALDGPEAFDRGPYGRQWFSIAGVTEADRPRRVAGALPLLAKRLDQLAEQREVARDELVLLGFSQGAIMTLAMVAQGLHRGRAIAVAGRLAAPMLPAADCPTALLLVHDQDDGVMPLALSQQAATLLTAAGHQVDLSGTSGVGHGIGGLTLGAVRIWLATHTTLPTSLTSIEI